MQVDHTFQMLARRLNARFSEAAIARHEGAWIRAAYSRRERTIARFHARVNSLST